MPPVYDPTTPAIAQNDDWSCAVTSARWAMTAFGRHPSEQWIESEVLAEGVESKAYGLLDGTGAALARFLTEQYAEFGYSAYNVATVTFDDIRRVAGLSPVLIGGRDWAHWTGVRSYDASSDTLALANPADQYRGVGQGLTRAQFANLGPFSMVVIQWADNSVPSPDAAKDAEIARLRTVNGYLSHDVADALTKEVDTIVADLMHVTSCLGSLRAAIETLRRGGAS